MVDQRRQQPLVAARLEKPGRRTRGRRRAPLRLGASAKPLPIALPEVPGIAVADLGVLDALGDRRDALLEAGAPLGGVRRMRRHLQLPDEVDERARALEDLPHRGNPLALDQGVGVLAGGKGDEAQGLARLEERQRPLGRARRGTLSGGVAVEAEDGLVDKPPQFAELRLGQGGAEGGDRDAEARLMQGDHVHIAFDDDEPALLGGTPAGMGQAIEHAALMEELALAGVEVFGRALAEHAAPEGDDAAAPVGDREDDAAAEIVEGLAPGAALKLRLVEGAGALEGRRQGLRLLGAGALLGRGLGDREPGLGSQALDRLGKAQALAPHHEADHVAMGAATEAMEEALLLVDPEGGRLLAVEGAKPRVLAPLALKLDAPRDHLDEAKPAPQLVKELW